MLKALQDFIKNSRPVGLKLTGAWSEQLVAGHFDPNDFADEVIVANSNLYKKK